MSLRFPFQAVAANRNGFRRSKKPDLSSAISTSISFCVTAFGEALPIAPFSKRAFASLIAFPLFGLQIRTNSHLIRLGPPRGFQTESVFKDLSDRNVCERIGPLGFFIAPIVVIT